MPGFLFKMVPSVFKGKQCWLVKGSWGNSPSSPEKHFHALKALVLKTLTEFVLDFVLL